MADNKKGEEKRAVHTDIKSVRKTERSIRTLKRILAVLIVLLIGLIIYTTYPFWLPMLEDIFDKPSETIANNGELESGNFPIDPDEDSYEIYAVKNNLMTADAYNLVFYDENGKERSSYSYSYSNPIVRVSSKRVLVFDSGSYDFAVYNKSGEIYSKSLDEVILTGAIGADGTAAIVTESDKYASVMTVYDGDGKEIYSYSCTQRIIAVSIDDDGEGCTLCTFSSDDGEIYSQARTLDFSEDGEQMLSDSLECLALGCVKNDAGNIVVVGDTGIYTVSSEGGLVSSLDFDGELVSMSMDSSCTALLVSSNTDDSFSLIIAQADAQSDESYRIVEADSSSKLVRIADDRVLLLSSGKVESYAFSATIAATAELEKEYSDMVYINGALYLSGKQGIDKLAFEM
ncbi:MAG: DUF5711 family protein [Ruminococcus sp.]|nr:DUF5711 family protein [Ruminococcus sp.]